MKFLLLAIAFAITCIASTSSLVASPTVSHTPTSQPSWSPAATTLPSLSQVYILCTNCATRVCPPGCGQNTCVLKWARCSSSSSRCCSGWRCVVSQNPGFKGRRCEPPCTPKWWRCGSSTPCCGGWGCVESQNPRFRGPRCEPPPTPSSSSSKQPNAKPTARRATLCINCGTNLCPSACGPTCVLKWARCSSSSRPCCSGWRCVVSQNPGFKGRRCEPPCTPKWWRCGSNTPCCGGWRCVESRNPGFRGRRCEPPPPKCIPKWWNCSSSSTRCCSGWRCVRPARPNGFRGLRCEPPPKCIPKWWHCKGSGTRCCAGWRCIRSPNPGFQGFRCEP